MKKGINILAIFTIVMIFASCKSVVNHGKVDYSNQESKHIKVLGAGYTVNTSRELEERYVVSVKLKDTPSNAKYLIADFEQPNNLGYYERKILDIDPTKEIKLLVSDPIYGQKGGFYKIKVYLTKDKDGVDVIDKLVQNVNLPKGLSEGRDYAKEYKILFKNKSKKKVIVIYPNNRKKKAISLHIPSDFKIGNATVKFKESSFEYIPKNETVYNWSKILTLQESSDRMMEILDKNYYIRYVNIIGLGFNKDFPEKDNNLQIGAAAFLYDKLYMSSEKNFLNIAKRSKKVISLIDYPSDRIKKKPYEREFLAATILKSDKKLWEYQYTFRYDKRISKKELSSRKIKAIEIVGSASYMNTDLFENFVIKELENDGAKIESRRLDDREMNKLFHKTK